MKLILDLDSALADLMTPWMLWLYNKGYSDTIHELSEITSYDWLQMKYGHDVNKFFQEDPEHTYSNWVLPFAGAKDFIEWCSNHFDDIEIVTHSSKPATEVAKTEWVREYLNFDKIRFFNVLEDKFKHIKNSILFDDYPLHAIRHAARNGCPSVVFDYYKENGWSKISDYSTMIKDENCDLNKIRYATTYEETKKYLLELKELFG